MENYNEINMTRSSKPPSQSYDAASAGQPDVHNSDCLSVMGLLPRTHLPDPEIPDIAAMDDGQRRLWLASRCDPVADQLPQTRRTLDGYPPGDLQPGTQRNTAACAGAARPGPESVAPAGDVAPLPRSDPYYHRTLQKFVSASLVVRLAVCVGLAWRTKNVLLNMV